MDKISIMRVFLNPVMVSLSDLRFNSNVLLIPKFIAAEFLPVLDE